MATASPEQALPWTRKELDNALEDFARGALRDEMLKLLAEYFPEAGGSSVGFKLDDEHRSPGHGHTGQGRSVSFDSTVPSQARQRPSWVTGISRPSWVTVASRGGPDLLRARSRPNFCNRMRVSAGASVLAEEDEVATEADAETSRALRVDGRPSTFTVASMLSTDAVLADSSLSFQGASPSPPPLESMPDREDSLIRYASDGGYIKLERCSTSPREDMPLVKGHGSKVADILLLDSLATKSKKSSLLPRDPCAGLSGLAKVRHSPNFERAMGMIVAFNSLILGIEASIEESPGSWTAAVTPELCLMANTTFCLIFVLETTLCIYVDGFRGYFLGHNGWHVFDFTMVVLQVLDQFCRFHICIPYANLGTLRVIRIIRLVRVLHLVDELRSLVTSVFGCWEAWGWSLMLMLVVVYMFSVFMLQVVAEQPHRSEELTYWFNGLGRSFLTMFECIVGGVSWDEVVGPLVREVSPVLGVIFCGYITIGTMAILNLITGYFVETVIKTAMEDKEKLITMKIAHSFLSGGDMSREITEEDFKQKMASPALQDYLRALDLNAEQAGELFKLLDSDGSGSLDADEIVRGCLSLKGTAKGLDVCIILREIKDMQDSVLVLLARSDVEFNAGHPQALTEGDENTS